MVCVPSVTTTSSSTPLANVCRPVLLDSGLIAESLTPLLIKVTGVVLVLLVTKVPTLVHHVPDQNSLIVPAVMTAGSKTVQTAASNVTPSVPPARVLEVIIVFNVSFLISTLELQDSITWLHPRVMTPVHKDITRSLFKMSTTPISKS